MKYVGFVFNQILCWFYGRCTEEEESSVWVRHATGGLWSRFTPKARGQKFVLFNVFLKVQAGEVKGGICLYYHYSKFSVELVKHSY